MSARQRGVGGPGKRAARGRSAWRPMAATWRRWWLAAAGEGGRRRKVNLGGVHGAGGRGVERRIELDAARLVVPEDVGEHLGAGGHQVGGHASAEGRHYLLLVVELGGGGGGGR